MSRGTAVLRQVEQSPLAEEPVVRWIIAAPGEIAAAPPVGRGRYALRGAGDGVLAMLVFWSTGWLGTIGGWLGYLLVPLGALLGVAWRSVVTPRSSRSGRQLSSGKAVRLTDSPMNRMVADLAGHRGPLYWQLAGLAADRDRLSAAADDDQLPSAERTVRRRELAEASVALRAALSEAQTGAALRALSGTEGGVDATGIIAAGLYLSVQQGRAAVMDADS